MSKILKLRNHGVKGTESQDKGRGNKFKKNYSRNISKSCERYGLQNAGTIYNTKCI